MSSACLMHMHKAMLHLHYESGRPEMHYCIFTISRIFSSPMTFDKQTTTLSGSKSWSKLGNGEEKINKQSTKSAEKRDKATLGQRRKERKLGIQYVVFVLGWIYVPALFTSFKNKSSGSSRCMHMLKAVVMNFTVKNRMRLNMFRKTCGYMNKYMNTKEDTCQRTRCIRDVMFKTETNVTSKKMSVMDYIEFIGIYAML